MKTWIRILLAVALVGSTQVSCSVNDYCLNCEKGDGGGSGMKDGGTDGGSADAAPDAGCVPTGAEECNGKDDDCNGLVDDGVLPSVGDLCSNQNGACAGGVLQCTAGALKCSKQPSPETCNGIDDNCSGPIGTGNGVDEGDPGGGGKCGTDQGECIAGQFHCDPTTGTIKCFGFVDHTQDPELCNGKDDDCDGSIDDNVVFTNPDCGPTTSTGECNIGTLVCQGGGPVCTNAVFPKFEICNGLDDNCDGNIDEIFNKLTDPMNCGTCQHVCTPPSKTCIGSNNVGTSCTGDAQCPGGSCVDNSVPKCVAGGCTFSCKAGFHDIDGVAANGCEYPCFSSGVEVCDGVDNDCDGTKDNGLTAPAICKGLGECGASHGMPTVAGYRVSSPPAATCSGAGGWTCTYAGTVQFPEKKCDGLDNNCDGNIDEFQTNLGQTCHEDRETVCTGAVDDDGDGKINDGCPAVGPAEAGTDCADNVDNDSDGAVNDGCPAVAQLGICQGSGAYACDPTNLDGPAYCAITTPGSAPAAQETCNGKDDNCNGQTDEGSANGTLLGQEWVTVGGGRQMMKYEASKPDASATDMGAQNITVCSKSGVQPWTNVKYPDAAAACASIGAQLCTEQEWHRACSVVTPPTYPIAVTAGVNNFVEAENYKTIAIAAVAETAGAQCTDALDNDNDGLINDGCAANGTAETNCHDNVDNDGDGAINDGCPATGPAWVEDSTAGYSGISAMEATANLGNNVAIGGAAPRMDYTITITGATATYHVFVKMFSNSANDNTVYVGVASGAVAAPTATATTASNGSWQWREAGTGFSLAAGTYTVSVYMGKDGVKVDKLDITTSAATPTDSAASAGFKWAYAANQNTYQPNTCNGHDYQQVNISTVARANTGVATITTTAAHPFAVGSKVEILGTAVGGTFDGVYTVASVPSTTSFTYLQTTNATISATSSTGTASDATDGTLATGSLASCKSTIDTGAFDMSGNVREWTQAHAPGENPIRGGAANGTADGISCPLNFTLADDAFFFPNIGFRCCRTFP